jgi:23S rRNA pseudouridine2605 synthase
LAIAFPRLPDATFGLPTRSDDDEDEHPVEKPRKRAGVVADRKGRRVVVERAGTDGDDKPHRKGPGGYKGKRHREE